MFLTYGHSSTPLAELHYLPAQACRSRRYTLDRNVWGDRPFYLVKQPQEKWACDFRDDAPPLSFQLQVADFRSKLNSKISLGKIAEN